MKGYVANIEATTLQNENFRHVIYTGKFSQLVLMSIAGNGEIGEEVHDVDQFFRIESGTGSVVIDGVSHDISDGTAIVVPAGARHNVINTSDLPLKLYTLYAPPHHKDGTIHMDTAAAQADSEHFDGSTTE